MPASRSAPLATASKDGSPAASSIESVLFGSALPFDDEPRPNTRVDAGSNAEASAHADAPDSTDFTDSTDAPALPDLPALFDALAPLVTDAMGATGVVEFDEDPFQALVADIAIHKSREAIGAQSDRARHALLRAVAELAETHAVAADLACEQSPIDLPLDVPDPVFATRASSSPDDERPGPAMLIVPDMIRACRDRLAVHTTAADRTKIDIVAGLFDRVLGEDRVATDVRNTLARLQLPVLRIALADEAFFESRTHPTRRLLARLAASAVEFRDDGASSRTARAALERVVHQIIRGSFEDAGEHARLLEQFERAIIDIATAASAMPVDAVTDAEDRDVLVIKATIQISQLLAGIDVDREVRFFLLDVWSRVLVEIACDGADLQRDALLARAKRLCFDLAWSTAPKATSGERARLAGLLPTMIAAIRDGLRLIDHPPAAAEQFFAEWTKALSKAVAGVPGTFSTGLGSRPVTGIDAFAQFLREGSFGPEVSSSVPSSSGSREAGSRQGPSTVGLRAADDVTPSMLRDTSSTDRPGPVGRDTNVVPPIEIAALQKGDRFDLRDSRGMTRVRLSWISPLRSFYLFVGSDCALTRSFDPAALAGLIDRGELRRTAD